MNRIILILLIAIPTQIFGQEFSTIHFISKEFKKDELSTIYLNENQIGTIGENDNIHLRIFSKGRFTVTIIEDSRRYTSLIEIGEEKDYYFQVYWKKSKYERIDKELGITLMSENTNDIEITESLKDPIGELPDNFTSFTPSQGTGFLINNEGFILTNFHVIDGAKKIEIRGIKGDFNVPFNAKLVTVDRHSDLALLKVESNLIQFENPPYVLLNSDSITKAESVFALGYPMENALGSEVKVTNGIINSLTGFKQSISEVQISAAVQGGNSGGPLFNSQGEIIGIISAKIRSDIADQVGYAIKSNYIEYFLKESGVTESSSNQNQLKDRSISEQVSLISNFVYLIKTE